MEPNRFNSFWENYEKPVFDPFWPPFDPISRERKMVWTRNLAQICKMMISSFNRRWNQIGSTVFEKMTKNPILTPVWPLFAPYLENQNFPGLVAWHTSVTLYYLLSVGRKTKSLGPFSRKSRKTSFLTPFSPKSRPPDFFSKIRLCYSISFINVQVHAKNLRKLMNRSL